MMVAPRILIMAPVHNRRAVTETFIRNLLAQGYGNWHLLLIDDGSTDGTADMARAVTPPRSLTVLRGTGNWWWAGALHKGYQWLKRRPEHLNDLVLIMNDDTEFGSDFLANAVAAMQPRALLLAQLYSLAGEFEEVGVNWDWPRFDFAGVKDIGQANCFSTRGLFLWARDFLLVGGFHPFLLPHYLSDYEFTMRARRKGLTMITSPGVHLRYNEQLSGIRSQDQTTIREYVRKNLSIRSANNPVYWSSFILLAAPARDKLRSLVIVWKRFVWPIVIFLRLYRMQWRDARK